MANITITVQSLINTAVYDSYTIDNGQTVNQLKTAINSARGYDSIWYDLSKNETVLSESATLASLGIVAGTALRTHNKIGHLASKELKQKAKLDLAALDRAASSEPRATLDLTTLPTQFAGNAIVDNPNIGGLVTGRPWIETVSTFTFYEAINSTTALSTTQYVKGNKIYAYSSSFDVPSYQNARVVVNDVELLNSSLRGHNLVVLDPYGDLVAATTFDTYGNVANLTTLATALNAVPSGYIIAMVVYDASALDTTCRNILKNSYGSTNNNTWTAIRYDQIFIGVKA
jgi:hypothetical protein